MTITTQRILAAVAAMIVAALTGLGVGFLMTTSSCETPAPVTATATSEPTEPRASENPTGDTGELGHVAAPPTTATAATTDVEARECSPTATDALIPGILATSGALATAIVTAGLLILTAPRTPISLPAPPTPDPQNLAETDRLALVQACVYVRDRVTSKALGDRLVAALTTAGVTPVEPLGVRFDPAQHEAGGSVPTADPAQVGTIAAIETPGYIDRTGRSLRIPIVTVYRSTQSQSPSGGPR